MELRRIHQVKPKYSFYKSLFVVLSMENLGLRSRVEGSKMIGCAIQCGFVEIDSEVEYDLCLLINGMIRSGLGVEE